VQSFIHRQVLRIPEMAYKFSESALLRVDVNSLSGPISNRAGYDAFIQRYGEDRGAHRCPFCSSTPQRFYREHDFSHDPGNWSTSTLVVCPACLWFRAAKYFMNNDGDVFNTHYYCSYQEGDVSMSDLPLTEIEKHLARHWNDRYELTPAQAEDLVASVFSEFLHCDIHYTTNGVYSPDGGVDFVLVESNTGIEQAFQVKRRLTDKPERVQPIREFIGTMALRGYEHGCFVTFAPRLTRTALTELEQGRQTLASKGTTIDVVDGTRLHDIIRRFRASHLRDHPLLTGIRLGKTEEDAWHAIPLDAHGTMVERALLEGPKLSLNRLLAAL
jgi:Restriction endonuclease